MVNVKAATVEIAKLAMLKFFPADKEARNAIVQMVCEMAATDEQVKWLVHRALKLYNEWPGPKELRACFCSKFRPLDGINAYSAVYADGIPSERENAPNLLEAPRREVRLLPGGKQIHEPVEDPKRAAAVKRLAASMPKMPSGKPIPGAQYSRVDKALRELETAPRDRPELPAPTPQIITREDVERMVAEIRRKKADAEKQTA
jgi:hypothetical protein